MKKELMKITGMKCASCSSRIEKSMNKLNGVKEASVNLATESLKINYNENILGREEIKKEVDKLGFKVRENVDDNMKEDESKKLLHRFILSAIFAIPLLLISMSHMVGVSLPNIINPMENPLNFALIQLILTIPTIILGYEFYRVGIKNLFSLSPNMDSLISISTLSAFIYGIFAVIKIAYSETEYAMNLYFESVAVILTLITLGKYLEAISKKKTSNSINALMELSPKKAVVLRDDKEIEIGIEEVVKGDIVIVKPGERLPVDGQVIEGSTVIDESMISGESMPVDKKCKDKVIGASINKTGYIKYRATEVGEDTVLSKIISLVEDAQASKAPIAKLADVISGYFVPTIIVLATLSSLAWFIGGKSGTFSLTIFISVLVIACPCALGLATPTAIMVASGKGAKNGILIKSGEALESTHKVSVVVLDKTGTITVGKPAVTDIVCYDIAEEELLTLGASAEKYSEHPLGEAVLKEANDRKLDLKEIKDFEAIVGKGISGKIDEKNILIGNKKLFEEKNIKLKEDLKSEKLSKEGKTPLYVALNGEHKGTIAVADIIKESSKKAVSKLHDMGIKVYMITGDNKDTAKYVGDKVGIDEILSEVLPEEKANKIEQIKNENKDAYVAMVGDGINDAPALAKCDVGIAVGSGTDVAIESADIVLMKNDLMDVITAIRLSKATIRNIKENLFWAFGYNVLGVPVAMGALYIFGGPLLNPMIGAAAMSLSSVCVISNALRLNKFK